MKKLLIAFAFVFVFAVVFAGCGTKSATEEPLPVKVLILPAFEVGEMGDDSVGEAHHYFKAYQQDCEEFEIAGVQGDEKLYYKDGVALSLLGEGKVSASVNTKAILSDPRFDFSDAYVLVTGCAGSAEGYGVLGDVFLITATVDYDLGHHADARDMTGEPETTWYYDEEYEDTAVVKLNKELMDKVYGMIKDVPLETTERSEQYLQDVYAGEAWANRPPQVLKGTSVTGDNYWKGEHDHANALLITETYGCPDPYAVTDMEDIGASLAVRSCGMLDRLIILRDSVNLDDFAPGVTPEKLWGAKNTDDLTAEDSKESFDIFETAMINNFKVGKIIVEAILNGEL